MNCEISPASALSCRSAEKERRMPVTMTRWQLQHYHVTILKLARFVKFGVCKRIATDCRRIRMIVWLENAGQHEFTVYPSNALFGCSQFEFQIPLTPTTDLPLYSVRARVQIEYTQYKVHTQLNVVADILPASGIFRFIIFVILFRLFRALFFPSSSSSSLPANGRFWWVWLDFRCVHVRSTISHSITDSCFRSFKNGFFSSSSSPSS